MNEQRALPSAGGQPGIVVRFRWALAALLLAVGIGTGVAAALILGGGDDNSPPQAETETDIEKTATARPSEQGYIDYFADESFELCVGLYKGDYDGGFSDLLTDDEMGFLMALLDADPLYSTLTDDEVGAMCETERQAVLTNQTFDEWCELAMQSIGVAAGSPASRDFWCTHYTSWRDWWERVQDWFRE